MSYIGLCKLDDIPGKLLPYRQFTITIRDSDAQSHTLMAGNANPLSWFPMPVMGCALISSSPKWECIVQFWRTPVGFGGTGPFGLTSSETIATALGLKPRV